MSTEIRVVAIMSTFVTVASISKLSIDVVAF